MSTHKRKCAITTRFFPEEYERVKNCAVAEQQPLAEWVREQVLEKIDTKPLSNYIQVLLEEVLALRRIVATCIQRATQMAPDAMQQIIKDADANKNQRALNLIQKIQITMEKNNNE